MPHRDPDQRDDDVRFYDAQYGNFASDLYSGVRAEAMGVDIGQNGWLTAEEQDMLIGWLDLDAESHLLDIACGSGGPTLRIAEITGCRVTGVDIQGDAIARATADARERGLAKRATFRMVDAGGALPFDDGAFDAIICIDAINHLPDRARVLAEWNRLLAPGGRLVFTDPIVVTGPISDEEMRIRSSIGFFLFVPNGVDDALLTEAGFEIERREDRTENMARIARRWHDARASRADDLRRIEGDETFAGQQRFLEVTARLAEERRLSRVGYLASRAL
jgi:SAM-dependent methyltransferase